MTNVVISVHATMATEISVTVTITRSTHSSMLWEFTFVTSDINVDRSLLAVPLINKTLEDNPIYTTPILVVAGSLLLDVVRKQFIRCRLGISHNSLRMCLETLLMQPGINADNVLVRPAGVCLLLRIRMSL